MTATKIANWLSMLHTNGVQLDLAQLLRYQHQTCWLNLSPKKPIQSKLAGSYLARTKGRGMEFDEVRHYQTGDDVRTIDWRVTARTGKVHTKLFREEKERPVFVLTDLSSNMHMGSALLFKSVQAAHLAAMIGWHAKDRGDKFGGIVFNNHQIRELKPAARHTGVVRYLHQLIALQQQPIDPVTNIAFADALGQLRQLCRPGSLLYIISDFSSIDSHCWRHIQAMRAHNEIRLCQITDPLDQDLPSSSKTQVAVKDQLGLVVADLANTHLLKRYHEQQQLQQQQLVHQCRALGLSLSTISAAEPLAEQCRRHSPQFATGGLHGYA